LDLDKGHPENVFIFVVAGINTWFWIIVLDLCFPHVIEYPVHGYDFAVLLSSF
jgi:hypothetical protein